MSSKSKRTGGKGVGKKAEDVAARLSSTMQALASTRAELNRAELLRARSDKGLVEMEKRMIEQRDRADAAEIMTRRLREEHVTALHDQLSRYKEQIEGLSGAATKGHEDIVRLHDEKTALLERMTAMEQQRSNLERVVEAEKTLREKLEAIHKETVARLDDFVGKTTPLIDHNKALGAALDAKDKEVAVLHKQLKDAAEQQGESLRLLTESQHAIRKIQAQQAKDRKALASKAAKAETLATNTLREAVRDKKELTRLLKKEKQLTSLAAILQARVSDLEARLSAVTSSAGGSDAAAKADGGGASDAVVEADGGGASDAVAEADGGGASDAAVE
jgi:myosin heavy subunit